MVKMPHPDIPKIRGSESKFNIFWVKYGHSNKRPHSRRLRCWFHPARKEEGHDERKEEGQEGKRKGSHCSRTFDVPKGERAQRGAPVLSPLLFLALVFCLLIFKPLLLRECALSHFCRCRFSFTAATY
jgi:hypothetical protein